MAKAKRRTASDPEIQALIEEAKLLVQLTSGHRGAPRGRRAPADLPKVPTATTLQSAKERLRKAELALINGLGKEAYFLVLGGGSNLPNWSLDETYEVNLLAQIMLINFFLLESRARFMWYLDEGDGTNLRRARLCSRTAETLISEVRSWQKEMPIDTRKLSDLCQTYLGNPNLSAILESYESQHSTIVAAMPALRVRKAPAS